MIASAMAVYGKVNNANAKSVAANMVQGGEDTAAGRKIAELESQLEAVENSTGHVQNAIHKAMDQRFKTRG